MTGRRHPGKGCAQTAILDPCIEEWLVRVHEECLFTWIIWKAHIQNGKQPDHLALMERFWTIMLIILLVYSHYTPYFFGWPWLRLLRFTHCRSMYNDYVCYTKLSEYQVRCDCRLNDSEAPKLICFCSIIFHYFTVMLILLIQVVAIIVKQKKIEIWVGIHCRNRGRGA